MSACLPSSMHHRICTRLLPRSPGTVKVPRLRPQWGLLSEFEPLMPACCCLPALLAHASALKRSQSSVEKNNKTLSAVWGHPCLLLACSVLLTPGAAIYAQDQQVYRGTLIWTACLKRAVDAAQAT